MDSCPLCQGQPGTPVWKGKGRHGITAVYQCRSCPAAFSVPVPAPAVLAAWYGESYFERHYGGDREAATLEQGALLDAADRRLVGAGSRPRLLDIGCGVGDLCAAAARRQWEAVGVESAPAAASRAAGRGVKVVVGDAAEVLSRGAAAGLQGRFDLVVFRDSLPHMARAGEALRGAVALLRPGGWVVVRLPNRHAGLFRVARWASFLTDASGILHLPAQVLHLDRQALATALVGAGLTDVETQGESEQVAENGGRYSSRWLADRAWRHLVARWEARGEPEALLGWGRRP